MGNCTCSTSKQVCNKFNFRAKLTKYIESNNITKFKAHFALCTGTTSKHKPMMETDEYITTQQGVTLTQISLNALAYSIRLGRLEIVRFLLEEANASLQQVHRSLTAIGKTPLDLICENGHLALLEYLLPKLEVFKPEELNDDKEEANESLFAETRNTQFTPSEHQMFAFTHTAIQRACEKGHYAVVKHLYTYFKGAPTTPLVCDLHYRDETTGENCALLAAKSGNLKLIKFLHQEVKADFTVRNYRAESALQLALIGSRRSNLPYLAVVRYLCEEVGVDVTYQYEEALLLTEEHVVVEYLEKLLNKHGFEASKVVLERKYALKHNNPLTEAKSEPHSSCILKALQQELESDLSSILLAEDSQWTSWSAVL